MRTAADPPESWGRLLPLRPAGEPSGSPSPVPTDRKEDGQQTGIVHVHKAANQMKFRLFSRQK